MGHGFLPPAINSVGLEPRLRDVSAQAGCQVRPELSLCFVSFHVLGLHDHAFGARVCFALGSWPLSASIEMPMSSIAVKECWQLSFDHPLYRQRRPPPACISSHYFGTELRIHFPVLALVRDWGKVVAHFSVALEHLCFFRSLSRLEGRHWSVYRL